MRPASTLTEPGRPAQLSVATENHRRDFVMFEHQADVPIELEAQIQSNPVHQLSQRRPAGQKAFVLIESKRSELHPKLVLTIPHDPARDRAAAKHGAFPAKIRPFARAERHPMADELLDLHGHAEEMLEDVGQAFAVTDLPN